LLGDDSEAEAGVQDDLLRLDSSFRTLGPLLVPETRSRSLTLFRLDEYFDVCGQSLSSLGFPEVSRLWFSSRLLSIVSPSPTSYSAIPGNLTDHVAQQ